MLEDVVLKIKSILQTNLPTKLDTIETQRGDGIVLDDIASFFISRFQKDDAFARPAIFVIGEDTPIIDFRLGTAREIEAKHIIGIILIAEDADDDVLQKKMWRTGTRRTNYFCVCARCALRYL